MLGKTDTICIHALPSLLHYVIALNEGVDPVKLGLSKHTGQHYSYEMDKVFFEELELPQPKYNLDVGSGTHAGQTGRIMAGVEKVLMKEKPDVVCISG